MINTDISDFSAHIAQMKPIATFLFGIAVVHTFSVGWINKQASRYARGTAQENFLQFLGEVEVIFGIWSAILIAFWSFRFGSDSAVNYLGSVNFTEALFVFCIMTIAATRPVISSAKIVINYASRLIPLPKRASMYISLLVLGPLLGSIMTEPAAMTVTAMLLKQEFFDDPKFSDRFRYGTLGLLFVNISIGGVLTNFAAPPVLMIAGTWKWSTNFMLSHFGIPAVFAVLISTALAVAVFWKELKTLPATAQADSSHKTKERWWVSAVHGIFLVLTVYHAHHSEFFIPLFLFFLGWCKVTEEYQDELKMRESLLVAYFLGGLVTLGGLQDWWLKPLVSELNEIGLFVGTTALTAITDNAALTYLGSLVPSLSLGAKYALVAGAVTGGGLTVIANAPNPAGYGILNSSFGQTGIRPTLLFLGALPFTVIAAICFWLHRP